MKRRRAPIRMNRGSVRLIAVGILVAALGGCGDGGSGGGSGGGRGSKEGSARLILSGAVEKTIDLRIRQDHEYSRFVVEYSVVRCRSGQGSGHEILVEEPERFVPAGEMEAFTFRVEVERGASDYRLRSGTYEGVGVEIDVYENGDWVAPTVRGIGGDDATLIFSESGLYEPSDTSYVLGSGVVTGRDGFEGIDFRIEFECAVPHSHGDFTPVNPDHIIYFGRAR